MIHAYGILSFLSHILTGLIRRLTDGLTKSFEPMALQKPSDRNVISKNDVGVTKQSFRKL